MVQYEGSTMGVQPFKRGYGSKNIIFISYFWSLEPAVGGPVNLFQYIFLSRESIFNGSSTYIQMGANKRSRSSKTSIVFQKKFSFFGVNIQNLNLRRGGGGAGVQLSSRACGTPRKGPRGPFRKFATI